MNMKTLKKVTAGAVLASSFGVAAPLAGAHGFGPDKQWKGVGPEHHGFGQGQHPGDFEKGKFEKEKFGHEKGLEKLQPGDQLGDLTVASVNATEDSTTVQFDGEVTVSGYYDAGTGTFQVISDKSFKPKGKEKHFKEAAVTINNAEEATALLEGTEGPEPTEVKLSNIELKEEDKEITISADLSASEEPATEEPEPEAPVEAK